MEAAKILSSDMLDIIFENRNKDYGAYYLRKTYNKRILQALVITAAVALLAFLGSVLANQINKGHTSLKVDEVTLQNIKPEEEKKVELPPPPVKQEPPKVEMRQFTPPVIKKDEEVQKPPPQQEELKEAKIDVTNQDGIKEVDIATPTQIDGGKKVIEEKKEEEAPFTKVEVEAQFPGGDAAWKKFLIRNLNANTPVDNSAPEGTYTVYVQFIVDKEGNISDVRALTNYGYGMEDEAARVIKKGPAWIAAIQNGRKVKAYRKQPITFMVTAE